MTVPTAATVWRPLLTNGSSDRAKKIIREIADALLERSFDESGDWTLAGGEAGIALFHAYLGRAFPGGRHEESSRRHLERATDALATTRMRPGLYAGFTGIAWVVEHLISKPSAGHGSEDDLNESIDEALEESLRDTTGNATRWPSCELVAGLVGVGIYALERLPRPSAVRILEHVVSRLAALSERSSEGITWFTSPEQLPIIAPFRGAGGGYNLGVAHGVPAVIGFLGQVCAAGIAEHDARELLEGAVSWLLAQRLPRSSVATFPTWIAPTGRPPAERVSWCYGNPGLAITLVIAARAVGVKSWEDEALELALASAAQGMCESTVVEAGICHGSAGNGHLFNRLFQATGDERFREVAAAWFARTFELQKPGTGLAGYLCQKPDPDGDGQKLIWISDPGFLTGVAGIGLALLAATTTVAPAWDRVILSSLPSRS